MEGVSPQFVIPQPLDGTRSWTASYDSFDQYRDNLYYCVRLFEGRALVGDIMACVTPPADITVPGVWDPVYEEVARIAASGTTNTSWRGYYGRHPDDPFTHLATSPFDSVTTSETSSDNGRWILRESRVRGHDIWQFDLIERFGKRVVHSWRSWSNLVKAVRCAGDALMVTALDGTEAPFTPRP